RPRAASSPGLAGLRVGEFRRDLAALERRSAPAGCGAAKTAELLFQLVALVGQTRIDLGAKGKECLDVHAFEIGGGHENSREKTFCLGGITSGESFCKTVTFIVYNK